MRPNCSYEPSETTSEQVLAWAGMVEAQRALMEATKDNKEFNA